MQKTAQPSSEIPYKAELLRKSLHLLALVIPISMFYLGKYTSLSILIPICLLALFLEFARVRSHAVSLLVDKIFGRMMRPGERPPIGAPVVINGATWVLIAATLLVFVFPVQVAAVSMIMFMLSDAAAALVGRRWGQTHWGASAKTVEGSLAFLIVAFVAILTFRILPVQECIYVALIAMVFELLPIPFNDNLFVPFVSAGVIYSLLEFVHKQDLMLFL